MTKHQHLSELLLVLENELKSCRLWQEEVLPEHVFLSVQPFCIDTMTFEQWLQFVFVERLNELVSTKSTLPTNCSILSMAEESFNQKKTSLDGLLQIIADIDHLLS